MRLVKGIEPVWLRVAGINLDSTPDLGDLPLEKIGAPTPGPSSSSTTPVDTCEVRGAVRAFLASSVIGFSGDADRIAKATSLI